MPDNAKTLFKTGAISKRAYNKVLGQTRNQPTKMANFEEKTKDEAGGKNRGHSGVASARHIDQNQGRARGIGHGKAVADGRVTGGGGVKGGTQPKRAEIDYGAFQKPDFPAGAKVKKGNRRVGAPKAARGRIPAQGGQYGGGGRDTQ
jgi:hypothetical protein